MSQQHQRLGVPNIITTQRGTARQAGMRRLNRLPIYAGLLLLLVALATIVFGLSSRGFWHSRSLEGDGIEPRSASNFAETLKRGVGDGIIGEPDPTPVPPAPPVEAREISEPSADGPAPPTKSQPPARPAPVLNAAVVKDDWKANLQRDHEEQIMREYHRQALARLQRADGARSSPLRIDATDQGGTLAGTTPPLGFTRQGGRDGEKDRLSERLMLAAKTFDASTSGQSGQDPQADKQAFLDDGRLGQGRSAGLVGQGSPLTLKRGSVIPAVLLTGINADLPGRILAQVSQHVYDSATGRHLLIPQGSRLLGRYDSKVSYGQSRVLVVWTDIVLPDGQGLDIGAMAGLDQQGQAGFKDKINRHLLATFGSAALVAMIGTGMDLALPDNGGIGFNDPSDAARRSFSETFGRLAERTISKNLEVQPTLSIRPGYRFTILVDQDLVFETE